MPWRAAKPPFRQKTGNGISPPRNSERKVIEMKLFRTIKPLLIALLCVGMVLPSAVSCNGNGSGTDTTPETSSTEPSTTGEDTKPVTDPATEPAAQPETDPETVTEPETESPEEIAKRKQEAIDALYQATPNVLLPIGGWSTPAAALRDGYTEVEGSYDAVFRLIAESGINFMITLEEWSSGSWPVESLSSAHKAGIKLWYNGVGQSADWTLEKIQSMLSSDAAEALGGIYIKDEPTLDSLTELGRLTAEVRAGLPEGFTAPVFSNLLPTYAPTDWIGPDYKVYLQTYMETCHPDLLIFDYYPFTGASGNSLPGMIANLAMAKEEADKAGIPLYAYVQSSQDAGMREPNVKELRTNINVNLAMGVKGYAYFLICEHYEGWGYSNMIDYKGQPTAMYKKIQTVNSEVLAMKGVYLAYENKGIIPVNYGKVATALEKCEMTSLLLDTYGPLTAATTTSKNANFLIGCFEDAEGNKAIYVVNATYNRSATIDLTFDGETAYRLWGSEGLEDMDAAASLSLKLDAGEGVFIEFKK